MAAIKIIIVLGPTGAGKSYQAKSLAKEKNLEYVSTGDLLRATGDPSIEQRIRSGQLAESNDAQRVLDEALSMVPAGRGIVIDGFPRTRSEMHWLDERLEGFGVIEKVIEINVTKNVSFQRLQQRHRSDDERAAIERKWQNYSQETLLVLDEYKSRKLLKVVDGSKDRSAVATAVKTLL